MTTRRPSARPITRRPSARPNTRRPSATPSGKRKRDAPRSTLALRIVRAAVDPDVSIADLTDMARCDPAFAVRMLSVVNSAAFGLPNPISDLGRAITTLGISGLRNLALSMSLSQMVPMGRHGVVLLTVSLRRALAARSLAEAMGINQRRDDYFTAGLLLESGLLALANDELAAAARLASAPALTRPVQERAAGLLPHPERGARLAEKWLLGEPLVEAIRCHHDPAPPSADLARVAWVAERVAAVFEAGDIIFAQRAAVDAAAALGLQPNVVDRILGALPALVRDASQGFDHDVGEQPDLDALARDAAAQLGGLSQHFQDVIRRLERTLEEKQRLVDELEAANEKLRKAASTDALTGLANHRSFQEALRRELSQSAESGAPLSVVMMDLDRFKRFNESFGHPAGDAILRAVAKLLHAIARDGDVPARYGGEEFAILLPGTDAEEAMLVAERLRANLEKVRMTVKGKSLKVTASFGITTLPSSPDMVDQVGRLIAAADRALYDAKRAGRNCVRVAVPAVAAA